MELYSILLIDISLILNQNHFRRHIPSLKMACMPLTCASGKLIHFIPKVLN